MCVGDFLSRLNVGSIKRLSNYSYGLERIREAENKCKSDVSKFKGPQTKLIGVGLAFKVSPSQLTPILPYRSS